MQQESKSTLTVADPTTGHHGEVTGEQLQLARQCRLQTHHGQLAVLHCMLVLVRSG